MTKKMKNRIIILTIMLVLININLFCYKIYGADETVYLLEEIETIAVEVAETTEKVPPINIEWYKPTQSIDNINNASKLGEMGNIIIGALQIIGTITSVTALAVIGIKYMIGSAEERAEYKKTMWPYVLGAIMVFAITNILAIVGNIATNIL